jgi:hypothetical protein
MKVIHDNGFINSFLFFVGNIGIKMAKYMGENLKADFE